MSKRKQPFTLKPFGNVEDASSFYQLLLEHLTWLKVHNFSPSTVRTRGVYVRAFALWCSSATYSRPPLSPSP